MEQLKQQTQPPATPWPSDRQIAERADKLLTVDRTRYRRLWDYCHNPMRGVGQSDASQDRPYRQAQEWGLPSRITGSSDAIDEAARKEIVIENDIGWRIETGVDYLFGKPLVIESAASDPQRRALIGELLRHILAHNGGILLLQQLALLGSVHGFVDVLVKLDTSVKAPAGCGAGTRDLGQPPASCNSETDDAPPAEPAPGAEANESPTDSSKSAIDISGDTRAAIASPATLSHLARMVRLEIVEPARALPFLSQEDFRVVKAYGQCYEIERDDACTREGASGRRSWLDVLRRIAPRRLVQPERDVIVELITPTAWRRYENGKVVAEGVNSLGRIPLVHVQNTAVPFTYSGASDVEPLIPLQDELNTRLSDRAHRITMQSFKMYLGKGIENFTSLPVSPGRMWMTENERADVIEFGGDANCPSEAAAIAETREALDKTSGVTPIAAGAVEGRIGNLTSAVALRITLQALLSKTEKKRTTYGTAIEQMCELALAWLDRAGVFATTPEERRIELNWPSPLPENDAEKLAEAEAKVRLGVPREVVLRELGY